MTEVEGALEHNPCLGGLASNASYSRAQVAGDLDYHEDGHKMNT